MVVKVHQRRTLGAFFFYRIFILIRILRQCTDNEINSLLKFLNCKRNGARARNECEMGVKSIFERGQSLKVCVVRKEKKKCNKVHLPTKNGTKSKCVR